MAILEEPLTDARLRRGRSWRNAGQMRLDGRTEKRVTMAIPVCLVVAENLLAAEHATTVNMSPHGARVVTRHRWRPDQQPRLASGAGELRVQATVVYCQPLPDGHFCVGLKFQAPLRAWRI
jgi:hypothetical protein